MRLVRPLLFAAAAVLAGAAPASAAIQPALASHSPDTVAQVVAVADAHWSLNPCAGRTTVRAVTTTEVAAERDDYANVLGFAPLGAGLDGNCRLTIVSDAFDPWPLDSLCSVIAHELGHLFGYEHTDDPSDVMYPALVESTPNCLAAFPPPPAAEPTLPPLAPIGGSEPPHGRPIEGPPVPEVLLRSAVERRGALILRLANRPRDARVIVRAYRQTAHSPIVGRRVFAAEVQGRTIYLPRVAKRWDRLTLRYIGAHVGGPLAYTDRCILGHRAEFGFDPSLLAGRGCRR